MMVMRKTFDWYSLPQEIKDALINEWVEGGTPISNDSFVEYWVGEKGIVSDYLMGNGAVFDESVLIEVSY
jgi:hypothetical protein